MLAHACVVHVHNCIHIRMLFYRSRCCIVSAGLVLVWSRLTHHFFIARRFPHSLELAGHIVDDAGHVLLLLRARHGFELHIEAGHFLQLIGTRTLIIDSIQPVANTTGWQEKLLFCGTTPYVYFCCKLLSY